MHHKTIVFRVIAVTGVNNLLRLGKINLDFKNNKKKHYEAINFLILMC